MWSATRSATLRSNCPLPWTLKTVTFAYVDPGHQTDRELYSWGAAHGPLWDALRKKGRQVRVLGIAAENLILDRTRRVLERWAAADPGTSDEGLMAKLEIKAIDDAMTHKDREFLAQYGGFWGAMKRSVGAAKMGGGWADAKAGDQGHRRRNGTERPCVFGTLRRLRGSYAAGGGAPQSTRSQAHGRSLD